MLRKLLNWLFGSYSSDDEILAGDFIMLLQENIMYLRQHRCRIVSTELPDGQSFTLHLTEANIHVDDFIKKLF